MKKLLLIPAFLIILGCQGGANVIHLIVDSNVPNAKVNVDVDIKLELKADAEIESKFNLSDILNLVR